MKDIKENTQKIYNISDNKINKNDKNIDKAAKDFEAMYLSKMLNMVFDQIEPNSLTGGGEAEKMLRSLLVDEYANSVVKTNSIGISEMIKAELIKLKGE